MSGSRQSQNLDGIGSGYGSEPLDGTSSSLSQRTRLLDPLWTPVGTIKNTGLFKIGKSKNPELRVMDLQTSCPFELTLLRSQEVDDAPVVEKALLSFYSDTHTHGEWFTGIHVEDFKKNLAELGARQ